MKTLGKYYDHDPRHFRFMNRCEGYRANTPAQDGSEIAWWLVGAGCGALILLALFG